MARFLSTLKMRVTSIIACLLVALTSAAPTSSQSLDFRQYGVRPRAADPSLTGYLGVFFLGDKPSVYFYQSNGNDANSFKALNRGQPVINPTKGTQGVRDPSIIAGGGADAGKKWYIIGTDLNIGKVSEYSQTARQAVIDARNRRHGTQLNVRARAASSSGKATT